MLDLENVITITIYWLLARSEALVHVLFVD